MKIMMARLIKVDGKVRTDVCYPAGYMDVITIEKTGESFRLLYDVKGRFVCHRVGEDEAAYKLCKIKRVAVGKNSVPYVVTHDARTYSSSHYYSSCHYYSSNGSSSSLSYSGK